MGHMVPANHFDHYAKALHQTNHITNILPQNYKMNRGAWLHTEEIIECIRDIEPLLIYGGPIWEKQAVHIESHSIDIPHKFWKVVFARGSSLFSLFRILFML